MSSGSDATSDVSGHRSEASTEDTPRLPHTTPARTLNAEFFGVALLPTPPPSIRSLSHSSAPSRDASTSPPPHRNPLPPLSRFFPSRARYGSESEHPSPSHAHGTNVRREFVHLDTGAPFGAEAYHAGEQTESPVEDQLVQAPPALQPHPPSTHLTPTATAHPPTPPPSEPEQVKLQSGIMVSSSSLELELVKPLGTGSFSSVWLARDTKGQLNALELVRKSSLARSKSLRGRRSRTIDGTRPTRKHDWAKERAASEGDALPAPKSPLLSPQDQIPRAKKIVGRHKGNGGRLVAVKMTERELCDSSSRSRVSFVREVEVLRVSLPSPCRPYRPASRIPNSKIPRRICAAERYRADKPEPLRELANALLPSIFAVIRSPDADRAIDGSVLCIHAGCTDAVFFSISPTRR